MRKHAEFASVGAENERKKQRCSCMFRMIDDGKRDRSGILEKKQRGSNVKWMLRWIPKSLKKGIFETMMTHTAACTHCIENKPRIQPKTRL